MKKILSLMLAMSMVFSLQLAFADASTEDFVEIMPISYTLTDDYTVVVGETEVNLDVPVQVVDDVLMVPLNLVSTELGYTVTWVPETFSVEISKGAQWTSIKIGENAYFQNKMAPWELSAAPVIIEGRTLVPVEFFAEILNQGFNLQDQVITFTQDEFGPVYKEGYVKSIQVNEDGSTTITTVPSLDDADAENIYMLTTSEAQTFYQRDIVEGDYIKAVVAPYMVMIYPPRVGAYVIY